MRQGAAGGHPGGVLGIGTGALFQLAVGGAALQAGLGGQAGLARGVAGIAAERAPARRQRLPAGAAAQTDGRALGGPVGPLLELGSLPATGMPAIQPRGAVGLHVGDGGMADAAVVHD
jgi:hypothetical protein